MRSDAKNQDATGLDQISPDTHPGRDARHFRAIIAANENLAQANQELIEAVRQARQAGDSWFSISVALGVSRQVALKRFAHLVG